MKFAETDSVVCAYAESASGPGWANAPVWFVIRSRLDGTLRHECLQPDEQTPEMQHLYSTSLAAHLAMTAAVRRAIWKR